MPNSSSTAAHIFRVLGLHVIANYMWIIEINFKNEYCKGPIKVSLSDYEEKLKQFEKDISGFDNDEDSNFINELETMLSFLKGETKSETLKVKIKK